MGAFKKLISSLLRRPLKNWNVEHRAQRLLDKQGSKPSAAPTHPSTQQQMQDFKREHPELLEAQKEKNEQLHQMLEGIIVNPERMAEIKPKSRPLPEDRRSVDEDEYGYAEPVHIAPGRCSLRQSLEFITNYQMNPSENDSVFIANKYQLDRNDVDLILKYFQTLQVQIPKGVSGSELLHEGTDAVKVPKTVESGDVDSDRTKTSS